MLIANASKKGKPRHDLRNETAMSLPTPDQIERIGRLGDPILRNLQITQCYYEISRAVAELTGFSANWCTFATWASKQAGQTIRQEDLLRAFTERLSVSTEVAEILDAIARHLERAGAKSRARTPKQAMLRALDPSVPFARAAEAVALGNKKVFEEIGRQFARFVDVFGEDTGFDPDKTARFCAALRSGEPPEGQRLLGEAFTSYCEARFRSGDEKTELMLLANLSAGLHEQIRLQPEITAALNASLDNAGEVKRELVAALLPDFLTGAARALSARRSRLDALVTRLVMEANRLVRQVITDHLMTLHLPNAEVLRLGRDLPGTFPASLAEIRNVKLNAMLSRVDLTPNSVKGSGAVDWADLTERMHYIADFFRVYQERRLLFEAPFTPRQVGLLKAGARPDGRL
jgi:hypothetical protein